MMYFLRHGQSKANADNVFAGHSYPAPLTQLGREQARLEGLRLKSEGIHFDRIMASPLERARDTASIIAEAMGFEVSQIEYDPRLAEYEMGALTGKSKAGVTLRQCTSAAGAERPEAFQHRVMTCLSEIASLPGNTLIVSHAGVIGMIEATRQGSDLRDFYTETYPNAKAIELAFEPELFGVAA